MKKITGLALVAVLTMSLLAGCAEDGMIGQAERDGRNVIEEGAQDAKNAANDAKNAVEDAADDTGDMMENAQGMMMAAGSRIQDVIMELEENLGKISSVTALLEEGKGPKEILELLLEGLNMEMADTMPVRFACSCDKKRVEKALISIGKKELREMIAEGKEIHVNCQFCGKEYTFSVEELNALLQKSR